MQDMETGKSLYTSWEDIYNSIYAIGNNSTEKPVAKYEALALLKPFTSLKVCFISVF